MKSRGNTVPSGQYFESILLQSAGDGSFVGKVVDCLSLFD